MSLKLLPQMSEIAAYRVIRTGKYNTVVANTDRFFWQREILRKKYIYELEGIYHGKNNWNFITSGDDKGDLIEIGEFMLNPLVVAEKWADASNG